MSNLIDGKPPWYKKKHKLLSTKLPNPSVTKLSKNKNYKITQNYTHPKYKPIPIKEFKNNKEEQLLKIKEKYTDEKKLNIQLKSFETKWNKKVDRFDKCIKAKDYKINITFNQYNIIKNWINECDKVYNYCVKNYNNGDTNITASTLKLKIFSELYGTNKKPAPYDTLTDVVSHFCRNVKSCYSNLQNGNITHFEMKPIILNQYRSMYVSYKAFNENGFFPDLLGPINNFPNIKPECDVRLIFNKYDKEHITLKVPTYINKIIKENKKPVVSLDPGENIFMTYYSPEQYGVFGTQMRYFLLREREKIKKYQTVLSKKRNKKNKPIRKDKIKKKINNIYNRIKNKVKEIHNKTALFLCKNYDRILIPKFETQKMIGKTKIKEIVTKIKTNNDTEFNNSKSLKKFVRLSKNVKYVLNQLSHYKFRQHLKNKSIEHGCQLKECTEEYTSMCCGSCGHCSKNYIKRIKKCTKCKIETHRDINGARNIFIKNVFEFRS